MRQEEMKFYLIEVIRRGQAEWFPTIVVISLDLREVLPILNGYVAVTDKIEDFRIRAIKPLEVSQLPKHVVFAVQCEDGFCST